MVSRREHPASICGDAEAAEQAGEVKSEQEHGEIQEIEGSEHMVKEEKSTKVQLLDIVQLIRSIQRAEGNPDCFSRRDSCDRLDCAWRTYCLISPRVRP